jgi:hypothetical protein
VVFSAKIYKFSCSIICQTLLTHDTQATVNTRHKPHFLRPGLTHDTQATCLCLVFTVACVSWVNPGLKKCGLCLVFNVACVSWVNPGLKKCGLCLVFTVACVSWVNPGLKKCGLCLVFTQATVNTRHKPHFLRPGLTHDTQATLNTRHKQDEQYSNAVCLCRVLIYEHQQTQYIQIHVT